MILLLVILLASLPAVWQRLGSRGAKRFERLLSQRYMRIVMAVVLSNEELRTRFPMIEYRGAKEHLSRVLSTVAVSLYGADVVIVGRIAVENGIDEWLLRRVRRTRGFRRAYYLSMLATLPLSVAMVAELGRYAADANPLVRFYALIVRIKSDSSSALRELAEYGTALTDFEMAEIMAILRRGVLPVACEPLLSSESRNLKLLGINIAREFGIEEVEAQLHEIVAFDSDEEVVREAIYALVALHSSFVRGGVVARIRSLAWAERRALCRHLAFEGYSVKALEQLFGGVEGRYAEALVATYKSCIVCTS